MVFAAAARAPTERTCSGRRNTSSSALATFVGNARNGRLTSTSATTRAATDSATVHDTLASQADTRRASVSGVSVDEELTLLMRYQQAFQAASRLVRTADEMMQSLLEMAT